MKKIVPIKNTINYTSDIVTCFERPIVNLLNSSKELLGDCFFFIAKMYSFYFYDLKKDLKLQILNLSEDLLKIKIERQSYRRIKTRKIVNSLNRDELTILAVNLYDVFYSEYYKENNWPHWLLINGYDTQKNILYFLDDVQYCNNITSFGVFCWPIKMITKAVSSYERVFNKDYSRFKILVSKEFEIESLLCNVIEHFISFDFSKKSTYTQIRLLNEYRNLKLKKCITQDIEDKFKSKIINNNKYRKAFIETIIVFMGKFNFNECEIQQLLDYNFNAEILWDNYITKCLLKIVDFDNEIIELNDDILLLESKISRLLVRFADFLKSYSKVNTECETPFKNIEYENNDRIIFRDGDRVGFKFTGFNTYDWWFTDNAPKVIMSRNLDLSIKHKIAVNISISKNGYVENFQAGIFLRSNNQSLFCAYDISGELVIAEIGKVSKSVKILCQEQLRIEVTNENHFIKACIYNSTDIMIGQIQWYFEGDNKVSVGIACKTWGNAKKVEAYFDNLKIEEVL